MWNSVHSLLYLGPQRTSHVGLESVLLHSLRSKKLIHSSGYYEYSIVLTIQEADQRTLAAMDPILHWNQASSPAYLF